MCFFFYQYNEVSVYTASLSRIAFAVNAQLHAFLYAGRYVQRYGLFSIYPPIAFTCGTLAGDRCPFTAAGRTGCYGLHLAKKSILYFSNLPATAACCTGLYAVLIFCPTTITGSAGNIFFYFYGFGDT